MIDRSTTPVPPRWLHVLAVLTVLLTLPLLFLGASVTSHGVGMVDPKGFRPPWEIVNGLIENSGFDWRLEYGHRTFGFLVGLCGIGLAVGCFFFDARPWVGWLAFLALAMICAQGALGIYRVDYNALYGRTFALLHGVFAQLVFAVLICLAYALSGAGAADPGESASPALRRWSVVTVLLILAQLILGGLVRHREDLLGPRGHLLGAFLVVAAVVWLLKLIRESDGSERFATQRIALMALLALQLWLGVESWLARFYTPYADLPQLAPLPMHAEWIRTAHYLVGTLMFATSVSVVLAAHQAPALEAKLEATPSAKLEGVA
ncbi:MAG: COX15/CtaA family protein [Planctomycetes bacterium]|nr:COX15/CtaA family protein [Planctomycetota bacterium]